MKHSEKRQGDVDKAVEKPVSLAPLKPVEALAALFAIPDPERTKPKNRKAPPPSKSDGALQEGMVLCVSHMAIQGGMAPSLKESFMDLGRGLRRAALLLVPYIGWWAYRGWTSYRDAKAFEIGRHEALRSHDYGAESTYFYAGQAAREALQQSLVWGVDVPVGLIVALALLYWVYRGFRPKRTSGPNK